MGYTKFRKEKNVLYHRCGTSGKISDGICEFTTSGDGYTDFKCRLCGQTFSLDDLTQDVANYYATPAY